MQYVVDIDSEGHITSQPVPLSQVNQVQITNTADFSMTQWILLAALAISALAAFFGSFIVTSQQTVRIIQRLGKFHRVAIAGFSLKMPFIDSVVGEMSLRIQELSEEVEAKTKDNAFVEIPVKVQYAVIPEKVNEAFYTLADAPEQIRSYITNIVRSTSSNMTMEEIFQSKAQIEDEVKKELEEKFSGFGFKITNVLVDNPLPDETVVDSFNLVIASKRKKEAAENEAEAVRVKLVGQAKAEAESLTLKATAYVEQRKAMADFFKDMDEHTAAYLQGIDYRDMVREASKGGNTILIVPSAEAGNDISSVAAALRTAKNV